MYVYYILEKYFWSVCVVGAARCSAMWRHNAQKYRL